jgi:branched-subunit amino acid aminotransferase/4-amino-4-deoxychorismate lyase
VTLRRNAHSPTSRLKVLSYLDNILARQEAQAKGADDALLLDTMGFLSCASAANVFLWEGEKLVTPSEDCAILPGVTRAVVIELARSLSLDVREERISVDRIAKADGGFLTNSLIGLQPLSRIEGRNLAPHRLTGRLAAAYEVLLDAADEEDEPIRRS